MLLNDYTMKLTDFDPEAASYNKRNALFLGEASQAAYESPASTDANGTQAWAKMAGFAECVPFGAFYGDVVKGRIEGFMAKTDSVLLVAFRGTDPTVGDWLIDLQTKPVRDPAIPGEVHEGFNNALLAVWGQVRPHLDARGNRRVWLTGHSLGGALAVACAARATFEAPRVGIRGIYTYGQPRYGNGACAEACAGLLGSVLFRHVNNRDIVPRVPPFVMGFRHWGTEILFDQQKRPHVNTTEVETVETLVWQVKNDRLDLSSLWTLARGKGDAATLEELKSESFEFATDHFMTAAYLPVLRRELDTQSPA